MCGNNYFIKSFNVRFIIRIDIFLLRFEVLFVYNLDLRNLFVLYFWRTIAFAVRHRPRKQCFTIYFMTRTKEFGRIIFNPRPNNVQLISWCNFDVSYEE